VEVRIVRSGRIVQRVESAVTAAADNERRRRFAVKVLGDGGLPDHDGRRWQSNPDVSVSISALKRILDYLRSKGIRMYRMTSDFVPYVTHPDMPQFHRQIDDNAAALSRVGWYARDHDLRLSLHPSQYIVLNAQDDIIARKSMLDLDARGCWTPWNRDLKRWWCSTSEACTATGRRHWSDSPATSSD
jgi:hypothetical protein